MHAGTGERFLKKAIPKKGRCIQKKKPKAMAAALSLLFRGKGTPMSGPVCVKGVTEEGDGGYDRPRARGAGRRKDDA